VPTLVLGAAVLARCPQLGVRQALLAVFRGEDEREVPAERFRLAVAQDLLGGDVPAGDLALGVDGEDRVVLDVLHQ
jgi:hypothetical protein